MTTFDLSEFDCGFDHLLISSSYLTTCTISPLSALRASLTPSCIDQASGWSHNPHSPHIKRRGWTGKIASYRELIRSDYAITGWTYQNLRLTPPEQYIGGRSGPSVCAGKQGCPGKCGTGLERRRIGGKEVRQRSPVKEGEIGGGGRPFGRVVLRQNESRHTEAQWFRVDDLFP